jgi:mannosyltransferase
VFGESAWALRLPACIFGIASIVMLYRLAIELISPLEAWIAAAVLAVSYHHIWFSQNARGYTLMGFLALYCTHVLLQGLRTGQRSDYARYVLASVAAVYTHLTAAFVVVSHAVVLVLGHLVRWRPAASQPLAAPVVAWVAGGLLSVLAYAPFIPALLTVMAEPPQARAAEVATASWALGEAIRALLSGAGVPAALAAGAFAMVGAVSLWLRRPLATMLLLMPAPVTAIALVALGQPLRPRFFFVLSGAAAILVGRGVGATAAALVAKTRARPERAPVIATAGALLLVVASAAALPQNYQLPKQDYESLVVYLDRAEASGARIVATWPACLPLTMYYERSWPCLETGESWPTPAGIDGPPTLVAYSMAAYIPDPALRERLSSECTVVRAFQGTLRGGTMFVCEITDTTDRGAP